jgi:hypothetical protein
LAFRDDQAEVLNLGLLKLALVKLEVEFAFLELFHDQLGDATMFFKSLSVD